MDIEIREFITYLHNRKRTSHNTEVSYQRDLKKMAAYFEERGIYDIREVGELELEGYLSYMERGQFASSTIPEMWLRSVHCFSIFSRKAGLREIHPWN
mgnify:CR=1 FL=1